MASPVAEFALSIVPIRYLVVHALKSRAQHTAQPRHWGRPPIVNTKKEPMEKKDIKIINKYKDYAPILNKIKSPIKNQLKERGKEPITKLSVTRITLAFVTRSGIHLESDDLVATLEKEIVDILTLGIGSVGSGNTSMIAIELVVKDEEVPNALTAISNYMYANPESKLEHLEVETGSAIKLPEQ